MCLILHMDEILLATNDLGMLRQSKDSVSL